MVAVARRPDLAQSGMLDYQNINNVSLAAKPVSTQSAKEP
jgi:hypothetical protein